MKKKAESRKRFGFFASLKNIFNIELLQTNDVAGGIGDQYAGALHLSLVLLTMIKFQHQKKPNYVAKSGVLVPLSISYKKLCSFHLGALEHSFLSCSL